MSDPYLKEHAMSEQALSEQSDSHLTQKGLLKLIEGRVSADARRQAFDHMRRCDGCARQFENAVMAERLLASDDDESAVPLPELDTLLPAILDEAVPQTKKRSPWLLALPALAMAAAAFVAVGLDTSTPDQVAPSEGDIVITPDDDGAFKTRGNGEDAAAKVAKGSIDLICIDAKGRPMELKDGGTCAVGSELYVAVKPVPERGALRLQVVDASGRPAPVIYAEAPNVEFPVADYAAAVTKQTEGMADLVVKLSGAVTGTLTLSAEICEDCAVAELAKPAAGGQLRRRHTVTVTVAGGAN
jgi:hypothetical protein